MKQSAAQLVWRWLWIALSSQLCKTCQIQDSSVRSHKKLICLITLEDTVAFEASIHGHLSAQWIWFSMGWLNASSVTVKRYMIPIWAAQIRTNTPGPQASRVQICSAAPSVHATALFHGKTFWHGTVGEKSKGVINQINEGWTPCIYGIVHAALQKCVQMSGLQMLRNQKCFYGNAS